VRHVLEAPAAVAAEVEAGAARAGEHAVLADPDAAVLVERDGGLAREAALVRELEHGLDPRPAAAGRSGLDVQQAAAALEGQQQRAVGQRSEAGRARAGRPQPGGHRPRGSDGRVGAEERALAHEAHSRPVSAADEQLVGVRRRAHAPVARAVAEGAVSDHDAWWGRRVDRRPQPRVQTPLRPAQHVRRAASRPPPTLLQRRRRPCGQERRVLAARAEGRAAPADVRRAQRLRGLRRSRS
jgi:hypothetical protein